MNNLLTDVIDLLKIDNFKTHITIDQIKDAKKIINDTPKTTGHLFQILCAMNLINAALKDRKFNQEVYYGMLKPKVSNLLKFILSEERVTFEIKFYINQQDHCAYIEIKGLQFSFHNITIDERLKQFANSSSNRPRNWKGVRLQKIAGELFELAINRNLSS